MGRRSTTRRPKTGTVSVERAPRRLYPLALLAAGSSLLILLAVYIFLPPLETPASSLGNAASSIASDSGSQRQPAALAQPSMFHLPQPLAEMDTETEQTRLLEELESAVQSYPDDAKIHYLAALTYKELLQTERAGESFKQSLAIEGDNAEVLVAYGDMLTKLEGKHEQAVEVLAQAVDRGIESDSLLSTLGHAYSELGELEKAVECFQRALSSGSQDSQTNLLLSQAFLQLERFSEAEQQARTALARDKTNRAAYIALSTALIRQNKKSEALELRAQMPKVESQVMPDDQKYKQSFRDLAANTFSMLGAAYISHDAFLSAEQALLHSIELEPTSPGSATLLADLLRRQGRIQDCMVVYQRLTEIQPDNPVNFYNLASLALTLGDVQLAERTLRRGAEIDSSGSSDLQLAKFLLGIGKVDDGIAHARLATERLGTVDAYLILIEAHRAKGDKAAAFSAYRKAKGLAPSDPRLAVFTP